MSDPTIFYDTAVLRIKILWDNQAVSFSSKYNATRIIRIYSKGKNGFNPLNVMPHSRKVVLQEIHKKMMILCNQFGKWRVRPEKKFQIKLCQIQGNNSNNSQLNYLAVSQYFSWNLFLRCLNSKILVKRNKTPLKRRKTSK